jgi:hypothetical protein
LHGVVFDILECPFEKDISSATRIDDRDHADIDLDQIESASSRAIA